MEQYIVSVAQRYGTLDEEQKSLVRNFIGTDAGQIVAFLLGPEMSNLIGELQLEAQQTAEPQFLRG
jgi:hypothetical protein